ncbi:MAG: macrolide ABC transporter ATP-binding protein [Actinobacteria bacterium RBG_19FT_COMBO_36_27]|nr:MAG: macrolide ABC transporter ATP-binding protein [Actinobacteria bacterium RBG_19FT_COMBO_36_27]
MNNNNDIIIKTAGITKVYRIGDIKVNALRGIDLEIKKGEFVAIMGPSGSGKSTLMNIIGCLDVPTSGQYYLNNRDISKLNDNQLANIRNKEVGFVFQTFNLLSRTNIYGNVELPMIYSSERIGNKKKKILDAIESVGLTELIKHRSSELSGGEKQRVAIARALVNQPSVILADEPTGNLDSRTGEEIMTIFQKLNREGKTIILVTHELEIARHTHKIIYLRDGIIHKHEEVKNQISAEERIRQMPRLEDELTVN